MVNNLIKIPEFSAEELAELKGRIRPVASYVAQHGQTSPKACLLYVAQSKGPFAWGARPIEVARDLLLIAVVTTYHPYTGKNVFEPKDVDILAQIPLHFLDKVVAYEVISLPQTSGDVAQAPVLEQGFYRVIIRLYEQG